MSPAASLSLLLATAPAADAALAQRQIEARIMAAAQDTGKERDESDLQAGCTAKAGDAIITFVKGKDGKVLLATSTAQPLDDVRKDIWLHPRFTTKDSQIRPSATSDWAYVHDSNGDGRIDQIAFLIGPLIAEPGRPDPDLPRVVDGHLSIAGKAQLKAVFNHMTFSFWQAVDQDFDGTADALAFPSERKETGWFRGWALLTDIKAADGPKCRMIDRDGTSEGECTLSSDGKEMDGTLSRAHRWASRPVAIFQAILDAAASCRLGTRDLRP